MLTHENDYHDDKKLPLKTVAASKMDNLPHAVLLQYSLTKVRLFGICDNYS